jgi:hypothetical protein
MQRRELLGICLGLAFYAQAILAGPPGGPNWVGSWATAEQLPEAGNALAPDDLRDATLRQVVHLSLGGEALRVHISNAFGTAPLHFTSVHVALPTSTASSRIVASTDRALNFSGCPDVVIPAGAEYISDPLAFTVRAQSDLAITFQWIRAPGHFDAVIDFDKAVRDPQRPDLLLPAYDSGDHLHPSPAGYRGMADAVSLADFIP